MAETLAFKDDFLPDKLPFTEQANFYQLAVNFFLQDYIPLRDKVKRLLRLTFLSQILVHLKWLDVKAVGKRLKEGGRISILDLELTENELLFLFQWLCELIFDNVKFILFQNHQERVYWYSAGCQAPGGILQKCQLAKPVASREEAHSFSESLI